MPYQATDYISNNKYSKIPPAKIRAYIKKNFEYKERKNGDELLICNPFTDDIKYKMNINPEKGVVHCWTGDEWAGPINPSTNRRNCSFIQFVRKYKKCSYVAAIKEIMGTDVDIRSYLTNDKRIKNEAVNDKYEVKLPSGVELLSKSSDSQAEILIKWLHTRGYTHDDIEKHELYHLGMDVYWPYYEFDIMVYWQSRSRLNKRFNFPSLDVFDELGNIIGKVEGSKGDFLYGFDNAESASYLIITEAIFDQHTLREQALASGGAILTKKQIEKIKILGPRRGIILSPDNDEAGIKSIISNYNILKSLDYKLYYSLPPKFNYIKNGQKLKTKDWNEIGQFISGFEEVRKIHDSNIKPINSSTLYSLINQERL